jgi:hypothetical protein
VSQYEACPRCEEERAAGRFDEVLNCHDCKGKGIVRVPASYICNGCGGPLCPDVPDSPNSRCPHGLVEETVSGGYDSPDLTDTTTYTFSLCEACLRKLFAGFKVPPAVGCYMGEGYDSYAEDEAYYARRKWKEANGHIDKLLLGLCNQTIECPNRALYRLYYSSHLSDEACCEEHHRGAANAWFVPFEPTAGIVCAGRPFFTREQLLTLANAWLTVGPRTGDVLTYHKYTPGCVADYAGVDSNTTSMLWLPHTVTDFPHACVPSTISAHFFEAGTAYIGSLGTVQAFRKQYLRGMEVLRAHILPNLRSGNPDPDEPHYAEDSE